MIGVEERASDNSPGLVPVKVFFVDKDAHKFRNSQRGMCLRK